MSSSLRIDTGDGNDTVVVQRLSLSGSVTVNTGRGNDSVSIGELTASNMLCIWVGEGDDLVRVTTNVVSKSATLGGGDGTDTLQIGDNTGNDLGNTQITGFENRGSLRYTMFVIRPGVPLEMGSMMTQQASLMPCVHVRMREAVKSIFQQESI
jgi:hypothetical protein